MDIVEFFELSSGKWFSHRTSHFLSTNQSEGGKSTVQVEILAQTDPELITLCQQYNIDPALALCGTRITWDGGFEGKEKQSGSIVLVPIANPKNPSEGKLLRKTNETETTIAPGHYVMGNDDALTLITEDGNVASEERLWFASPNLRLRTSILKQADGFSAASFCSEIRMGVTKPAS